MDAQTVRDRLATDAGIDAAIDWCRRHAVTKVYVETFRSGYLADADTVRHARNRFGEAGLEVAGCVTTTELGKASTGWNIIVCFTDAANQDRLGEIFSFTAELFGEIMIDDFLFTDCQCADCDAARRAQTVRIGEATYPTPGDTWADYRCELMVSLARDRVLAPARRANPNVKLIVKFPEWYDLLHEKGYDVIRETADFDRIWVGT
ncbi:MAG: hypothetical protein ACYTFO_03015, partial [Planctomycetota bacterium]